MTAQEIIGASVKQNWDTIARIIGVGGVAVVVIQPKGKLSKATLRELGWDGRSEVFRMADEIREWMAGISDTLTAAWLRRDSEVVGRLFVFVDHANFLVNYTLGKGLSFEPGSLDHERV